MAPKNSRVAVVGVGYSTIGRRTGFTSQQLTVQCVKAALEEIGSAVRRVVDGEQADLVLDEVIPVGLLIFVHTDRQHLNLGQLLLHGGERGQLRDARQTPGCPEVQNHNLAAVVGKMDAAVSIRYFEVRCRAAGLASSAGCSRSS